MHRIQDKTFTTTNTEQQTTFYLELSFPWIEIGEDEGSNNS